jgi:hypothetical protein
LESETFFLIFFGNSSLLLPFGTSTFFFFFFLSPCFSSSFGPDVSATMSSGLDFFCFFDGETFGSGCLGGNFCLRLRDDEGGSFSKGSDE